MSSISVNGSISKSNIKIDEIKVQNTPSKGRPKRTKNVLGLKPKFTLKPFSNLGGYEKRYMILSWIIPEDLIENVITKQYKIKIEDLVKDAQSLKDSFSDDSMKFDELGFNTFEYFVDLENEKKKSMYLWYMLPKFKRKVSLLQPMHELV